MLRKVLKKFLDSYPQTIPFLLGLIFFWSTYGFIMLIELLTGRTPSLTLIDAVKGSIFFSVCLHIVSSWTKLLLTSIKRKYITLPFVKLVGINTIILAIFSPGIFSEDNLQIILSIAFFLGASFILELIAMNTKVDGEKYYKWKNTTMKIPEKVKKVSGWINYLLFIVLCLLIYLDVNILASTLFN